MTSSLPRTRSYQLSYVGSTLERETGIEPATNSLEGCDSTTELLPPARLQSMLPQTNRSGGERRIRTSVARKERQIYSLLPLTTRPSLQNEANSKSAQQKSFGAGEGT